jgi:ubiquinone/menaquinone biosynthesis C-methylase UbiE
MPDIYADITKAEPDVLHRFADVLELRASDRQQQSIRQDYLSRLAIPNDARILEIGCGTGPVTRAIAALPGVAKAVGLDPSPIFLSHARALSGDIGNIQFQEGDARAIPFPDESFDAVVFHTTLCHIPAPGVALAEARRILRPSGELAIFEANYSTTNVALGPVDPLQSCAEAAVAAIVHDPHIVNRLSSMVGQAGFTVRHFQSHGYDGVRDPTYLLTIIDRGAEALERDGLIGPALAQALRNEARRRAENGQFFGHLAYGSLIATRD